MGDEKKFFLTILGASALWLVVMIGAISFWEWALGMPAIIPNMPETAVGGWNLPFYLGVLTSLPIIVVPIWFFTKKVGGNTNA